MHENTITNTPGCFWLCISVEENGVVNGTFQSAYLPHPISFHGLDDFLQRAEEAMDREMFPQAAFARRTLLPEKTHEKRPEFYEIRRQSKPCRDPKEPYKRAGQQQFWVLVTYRQAGSWQGKLIWNPYRSTQRELFFRSALELILAIRQVVLAPPEKLPGKFRHSASHVI